MKSRLSAFLCLRRSHISCPIEGAVALFTAEESNAGINWFEYFRNAGLISKQKREPPPPRAGFWYGGELRREAFWHDKAWILIWCSQSAAPTWNSRIPHMEKRIARAAFQSAAIHFQPQL
jgi:hypothetical protein